MCDNFDFYNFKPQGGAVETYDRIAEAEKGEELEVALEEIYPNGVSNATVNHLMCFYADRLYSILGMAPISLEGEVDEYGYEEIDREERE